MLEKTAAYFVLAAICCEAVIFCEAAICSEAVAEQASDLQQQSESAADLKQRFKELLQGRSAAEAHIRLQIAASQQIAACSFKINIASVMLMTSVVKRWIETTYPCGI